MRQVLVLGGSYFAGRVFAMYASGREDLRLHVVNRGRFPLNLEHVIEYRCDRHDTPRLLRLLPAGQCFDAVVDFCAYTPGDVADITRSLDGRLGRYILFSTASIYRPDIPCPDEDTPLAERLPPGPVGDYLRGKAALERELATCCGAAVPWDILRPAFIYGPYNYAPRENWLIRRLLRGEPVPFPADATGRWSFVYVDDIARALLRLLWRERSGCHIYNLAAPERVDYPALFRALELGYGQTFPRQPMCCAQVEAEDIPLAFPLRESLCCDGSRLSAELGMAYTPLEKGMARTVDALRPAICRP